MSCPANNVSMFCAKNGMKITAIIKTSCNELLVPPSPRGAKTYCCTDRLSVAKALGSPTIDGKADNRSCLDCQVESNLPFRLDGVRPVWERDPVFPLKLRLRKQRADQDEIETFHDAVKSILGEYT